MKHFEFWPPRLFELPYYLYLFLGASLRGLSIKSLAKANYALDHGEIGIGSKYHTQSAFDSKHFLPTIQFDGGCPAAEKQRLVAEFALQHGYPVILKSDVGSVGKGVVKIDRVEEIETRVAQTRGAYLVQKFTPYNHEYGVFYVRLHGQGRVTGINAKHFPQVTGDGRRSVEELARAHPRYTHHWRTFLQYRDLDEVPARGERVQLSFIGSHTMGCMFTDVSSLLTPALEASICQVVSSQPGFNFGRLDVKAESQAAFLAGEFVVIEVNGVASLPTHMFDPRNSLLRGYSIFLEHGRWLLEAASEHRHQPMTLASYREIIQRVRDNAATLNDSHARLMNQRRVVRDH